MIDLDALERLLAEATPGRWRVDGSFDIYRDPNGAPDDNGDIVCRGYDHADARLIVAMHSALPELIAAARERDGLRAEQGELLDLVADRTIDLAGAKTAARFIAVERDALRAEVERMRAVVEAARVVFDELDCRGECSISKKYDLEMALAALDAAKEGE